MITPSDADYKETKAILNGNITMNQPIQKLKSWIENQFNVKVIHIVEDFLDNTRPRLNVVLEEYEHVNLFVEDRGLNYDSQKQSLISKKFEEIKGDSTQSFFKKIFTQKKDKYFVCYTAFNPIAKSEIVGQIPANQLSEFKNRNTNGSVWQINDSSVGIIVFLHKNEEIEAFRKSGKIETLKKEFYEMVKPFDSHGYFNQNNISVGLDSKQNFDENYESNWYYYYK